MLALLEAALIAAGTNHMELGTVARREPQWVLGKHVGLNGRLAFVEDGPQ